LITDPDGDSLYISLISATSGTGTCGTVGGNVAYVGAPAWPGQPISGTTPIQVVADSFNVNSHTGEITFHPNATQRDVIVYNIQEYRSGVLVGTSQREINFVVFTCSGTGPCGLSTTATHPIKNSDGNMLFPNPVLGELTISIDPARYNSLTITNMLGEVVLKENIMDFETKINTSKLPAGVYNAIFRGENDIKTSKFVKM
jgi:hypothetical protein